MGEEFDYRQSVVIDASMKQGTDTWIRAVGGVVNQDGPWDFVIPPSQDRYYMLSSSGLEMSLKVTKADGTDLSRSADIVAPINQIGSTLWQSVEVSLNGHPFSGSSSVNVGYKTYLETLLSYDNDSFSTHLRIQGFFADTPGAQSKMRVSPLMPMKAWAAKLISGDIPWPAIPAAIADAQATDDSREEELLDALGPPVDVDEWAGVGDDLRERKARVALYQREFKNLIGAATWGSVMQGADKLNMGFNDRFQMCSGSSTFNVWSPVPHDFFRLNSHVGPGNLIGIKLTRQPDRFVLNTPLADKGYKLRIMDMKLHLRTVERRETIPPPLVEKYRMSETQWHWHVMATNTSNSLNRIVHGGVLPKTLAIVMLPTRAVEGAYSRNPWDLHNADIKEMRLKVNGRMVPETGLRFDFGAANPQVARAYRWLFENTGCTGMEKGNLISYQAFCDGSFVVPFDLTPDRCNGAHDHDAEYGYIDLEVDLAKPTPEPYYIGVYMMFPKLVVNDKTRGLVQMQDIEADMSSMS